MEPETKDNGYDSGEEEDDDLFGEQPEGDLNDEEAFAKLMLDDKAKQLMAKFMGQDEDTVPPAVEGDGDEENTNREAKESKGFHSDDSEEEKDAVKRRSDLQDHKQEQTQYTETGQEHLFMQQVTKMQEKKLEVQKRIKEFLQSTFDPVVFASISRLFAVEMLSYHQSIFESTCTEQGMTAVMSILTFDELKFVFKIKQMSERLYKEGCYNEHTQLLQLSCLFWKEILLKKEQQIKNISRGTQGVGNSGQQLYAYEIVSFLYSVLFFQGFNTRTGFLLSFDKLNLDPKYKLDMYSTGSNLEKPKKPTQIAKEKRKSKKYESEEDSDDQEEYDSDKELSEEDDNNSFEGTGKKPFKRLKLAGKSKRRTDSSVERDPGSVASSNENDKAMYEYGPLKGLMSRFF